MRHKSGREGKMRGQKHNDQTREKAFALLASGESVAATAKALGLKYSTVKTWEKSWKADSSKLAGPTQTGAGAAAGEAEKSHAQSDGVEDSDEGKGGELTLDELRAKKKRDFVDNSWAIIEGAQAILKRRVERAIHKEDVIDEIISIVEDSDLTEEARKGLLRKLSAVRLDDIRALSSILATCYDKQALAAGDPTVIGDIKKFEDL